MIDHSAAEGLAAAPGRSRRRVRRRRVRVALAVLVLACGSCSDGPSQPGDTRPDAQLQPADTRPDAPTEPAGDSAAAGNVSAAPVPAAAPKVSDLGPVWAEVFRGSYSRADGGVWQVWSEPRPAHPTRLEGAARGDHVLELLGGGGRVLVSVPFIAEEVNYSTGWSLTEWRVGVVDPPEYARYRIVRAGSQGDEAVVYEFVRSENAPTVSLMAPLEGEAVEGQFVELSWTVSDADGDELSSNLFVSADGGTTYRSAGWSGPGPGGRTTLSLDRARLEDSERARVMVVVSDGARWAAAESPVFSSAARYVPEPVVQDVPVEFVVSALPGDGDGTAAAELAGVTVAIVEWNDRWRWWEALGAYSALDGTGIGRSIPPGAQVASTAEQVAAAPARYVTTSADGTVHAELDRSTYYLFCAMSPDDAGVVAGCTSHYGLLSHRRGEPVTLHILLSHGRAYLSSQPPAAPTAASPGAGEASVTVVAMKDALPYANALGELVWTHLDPSQDIAIVADADIGRWWDTVSGGDPAALDHDFDTQVRVAGTLIEASPARVITTDHRGIATASLPAGNYLLCAAQRSGRTGYRQLACTYHHLANTHDNIFETWCCDPERGIGHITALNETDGRALLQQTQHLKAP